MASAACVGVGLPVGVIGPTLVMGALLGGLIGIAAPVVVPDHASTPALYVMLGMAAMMAAVLQAPLAALVAVLELTASPRVILPAMLIIAVATLTTSLFKRRSALLSTLATLGVRYPPHPAAQHLLRVGVASLMDRDVVLLPAAPSSDELRSSLAPMPRWLVFQSPNDTFSVVDARDLQPRGEAPGDTSDIAERLQLAEHYKAGVIDVRATLQEALTELNRFGVDTLCVTRSKSILSKKGESFGTVVGVLTREDIESQAWW